jgi:hypothetical protein
VRSGDENDATLPLHVTNITVHGSMDINGVVWLQLCCAGLYLTRNLLLQQQGHQCLEFLTLATLRAEILNVVGDAYGHPVSARGLATNTACRIHCNSSPCLVPTCLVTQCSKAVRLYGYHRCPQIQHSRGDQLGDMIPHTTDVAIDVTTKVLSSACAASDVCVKTIVCAVLSICVQRLRGVLTPLQLPSAAQRPAPPLHGS